MSFPTAPFTQSISLRDGEVDSNVFLENLLLSAEQVLRGGAVEGPFASITDCAIRRRLASELMLGDRVLDVGWRTMFLCHSRTNEQGSPSATPYLLEWLEPRPRAGNQQGDIFSRCWARYPYSCSPMTAQRRNRHQAAAVFPTLVRLAVHVAHSEERWPRVLSAWRAIDAIDEGRPLIPALAEFLSVGRAEIRASRTMAPIDWHPDRAWSETRRLLRTVVLLPPDLRPTSSLEWFTIIGHLPLLAVVAKVTPAQLSLALLSMIDRDKEISVLKGRPKVESSRMLALLAKELQAKRTSVSRLSRLGLTWIRNADPEYWARQRCARLSVRTNEGWLLQSIVSLEELSREGDGMKHCAARTDYCVDLLSGCASYFSIHSARTHERLTMRVTRDLTEDACEIQLGGLNRPGF